MSVTPLVAPLTALAAEAEQSGINPAFVGVGIFVVLLAMLAAVLAFGAGRDHS